MFSMLFNPAQLSSLRHVQRVVLSRLRPIFFAKTTLTNARDSELVVSRGDDAGSCSYAKSTPLTHTVRIASM